MFNPLIDKIQKLNTQKQKPGLRDHWTADDRQVFTFEKGVNARPLDQSKQQILNACQSKLDAGTIARGSQAAITGNLRQLANYAGCERIGVCLLSADPVHRARCSGQDTGAGNRAQYGQ